MNPQMEGLLRELATKLGVTVELLWGALYRQALISGLVTVALDIACLFVLQRFLPYQRNLIARIKESGSVDSTDESIPLGVLFIALWVGMLFWLVAVAASLEMALAAFFNRDYWALKQIMELLKK